ncbi:trypsin-like serine protease [Agrococcus citreus]|uniref:Peptidase S1 domain-containing protein n=1 Tax=Agrococcus citreus TaxID=84643 RepID=A0ABP4JG05_9MICO
MRRPLILAVITLALGTAFIAAPPATPAVSADDIPAIQESHYAVIDQIASWDARTPHSRIGTIEGDPVAGTIEIGWAGDVPSEVRAMARDAHSRGISVSFVEQESSGAELLEIAYDMAAAMPVDGAFAIGIGQDELSIEVPTEAAAQAAGSAPIPLEGDVLDVIGDAEDAAAQLGATVSVAQTDTAPINAAATPLIAGAAIDPAALAPISTARTNDVSVLSGGMRVQTQFRNGAFVSCTSGFTGFHGHQPVIVTAAHCSDYADDRAVRNQAGASIGRSDLVAELNDGALPFDLAVIAAPYDTRTLPRIYTGDTSTVNITSTQITWPPAGYQLCSSGQVTGWKCDITAGTAYVTCYGTPRGSECMHVQRVMASGPSAFCLGDSGGPIVSRPTAAGARAVGVVSGIRGTGSNCAQEGLMAPISQLGTVVYGLQLHTLP